MNSWRNGCAICGSSLEHGELGNLEPGEERPLACFPPPNTVPDRWWCAHALEALLAGGLDLDTLFEAAEKHLANMEQLWGWLEDQRSAAAKRRVPSRTLEQRLDELRSVVAEREVKARRAKERRKPKAALRPLQSPEDFSGSANGAGRRSSVDAPNFPATDPRHSPDSESGRFGGASEWAAVVREASEVRNRDR